MAYNVVIHSEKRWEKDMKLLTPKQKTAVLSVLKKLQEEPWPKEIKVKYLRHYDTADYRVRVADVYRILFYFEPVNKVVRVLRVLHRSKLY